MKALKLIRVAVAAPVLTLLTLFFLGVAEGLGFLAKIQIGPAIVGYSVARVSSTSRGASVRCDRPAGLY